MRTPALILLLLFVALYSKAIGPWPLSEKNCAAGSAKKCRCTRLKTPNTCCDSKEKTSSGKVKKNVPLSTGKVTVKETVIYQFTRFPGCKICPDQYIFNLPLLAELKDQPAPAKKQPAPGMAPRYSPGIWKPAEDFFLIVPE